jgi:putative ABC transport system permease protein
MLRTTFKSLVGRRLRLMLSMLAIAIGVSGVVGAFVLTDSLGRTFDDLFATVNKNIAVDVRGTETADGSATTDPTGTGRHDVPASTLQTVRGIDGVAEAQPAMFGTAVLVGSDNKPVTTSGAPTIGTNWVDSDVLNPLQVVEGNPPRAPDEIVIDSDLADEAGKGVGDDALVLTDTGQQRFRIVGITNYFNGKGSLGGETLVTFTTATAQKVLDSPSGYTELQVAAEAGVSEAELRDRVAAALPANTEAITGAQLVDEQSSDVREGIGFVNTFLLVFAGVVLFVGAFIIFNTFTILIAQRTRELALLRAMGASRRQVSRSVLIEALVVGTISAAIGLGAGLGVAIGLQALFGAFGAGLPDSPLVLEPRTVIVGFAVGILVTAVSAYIPARRAAKVAPVAAMRDAETPDRPLTRQTIGGSVLLVLGAAGMAVGLTGNGLWFLGLGTLLAFVGVAMLSPLVSRPVTRLLGAPFSARIAGRLGKLNSQRNPRRTAATAAALMIGLALVAAVGVLGASFKESVRKVADVSVGADFILNTVATGISQQTLDDVAAEPGVAQVTGLRFDEVRFDDARLAGEDQFVTALPPAAIDSTVTLEQERGSVTDLGPGRMLVSDELATDNGWSVGTTLDARFSDGTTEPLEIVGTYKGNELVGDYLLDESAAANFASPLYGVGLVKADPGADAGQLRNTLERAVEPYPNIELQDRTDFVGEVTREIDQLVQFFTVLLALSVLIALLGIVNTLGLSVLERTRELGLLRAVGLSRRQTKRMIRVESVLIAVFGGLLGLAVGSVFGVALQRALSEEGVTELAFPFGQLAGYVVVAALAGVLAAWLPARRASRLNVLEAIAAE